MGSASNISSATSKTPNLAASALSSISSSYSIGQMAADGLFADILSQNQPPPAPPPQNNNTQGSPTSSSQSGPPSAQDTDANDTQNSGNSGAPVANQTVVSRTGTGTATGKISHRHDAKQAGGKNKPDNTNDTNNQSAPNTANTAQADTSANTNANADTTSATVTAVAGAAQNDANGNNDPANNNSNANNGPSNTPVLAADLNAVAATAVPSTPAAPQTTDPSPAANDNTGSGAPASSGDLSASQLMLTLMQLEHLTSASHLADPASFNANVQAAQDPTAAAVTAGTDNTNTKGQIDLKALLAAVTKSNTVNFLGGDTSQTNGVNANQDSQNAVAANTTPSIPNTQTPTNSSQTQQAPTDKWMNANFVNLFNLANTDQNNTAVPLALNSLINPGSATPGSGDGASLDDSGQGQNETSSHDLTASTQLPNNLPQTTGTTQASNPYDFASQLSAMRATKGGPTGLPTPVEQVMLQLSRGLSKDGSTQMSIQLRPAELGRIDVKLNVGSDGKVQGTVTADNPATLNLLLKDVRGLERALQEAGLRADSGSLQFNLRGEGQTGGSFNQTANNSSGSAGGAASNAQTSLPVLADQVETYYLTPGGVNMRV